MGEDKSKRLPSTDKGPAYEELIAAVAAGKEFSEVASLAAQWAQKLLGTPGASATRVLGDKAEYIAGVGTAAHVVGRKITLHDSFTGNVVSSRTAKIFDPLKAEQASGTRAVQDRIQSGVVAPVVVEGRVIGTLGVASGVSHDFGRDSVEILNALADFVGLACHLIAGQRELREARQTAETASRAKSAFVSTMSHELRTPLTVVIGMIALLLKTKLEEDQQGILNIIKLSADTLLHIINDLLDFSTLESGEVQLKEIPFELSTAVEDIAVLMAPEANRMGLELACSVPARPYWVVGDPDRLRQILLNLINNAIKFTPEGEILVSAALREGDGERSVVRFEVRDTGIGVQTDKRSELFEAFTQADQSSTRKYGGTGVGLAICARLCRLMGGEIGVESEPDQGTLFWIEVPLAQAPDEPFGVPRPRAGARVLLVDRHPLSRGALAQVLVDAGLVVEQVGDGSTALDALHASVGQGEPYDLVVASHDLPRMTGPELARTIKHSARLEHLQLVLLSRVGAEQLDPELDGEDFAARLTKPVRRLQLLQCVERLVEK